MFDGAGAVHLLDHDAPCGILLLERVTPDTPLFKLQEGRETTYTAAVLMRRLWRRRSPPAEHLSHLSQFGSQLLPDFEIDLTAVAAPFPTELISKAEDTFAELNATRENNVILHGDLHHANILISEKEDGPPSIRKAYPVIPVTRLASSC